MPLAAEHAVTHGVHAAMDRMQAASGQPPLDRAAVQADLPELPPGDHPVLGPGQRGDQRVARRDPHLASNIDGNVEVAVHGWEDR